MNVMGELMDLQAGGTAPRGARPRRGRRGLPAALRAPVDDPHRGGHVSSTDRYQIHTLLRTLNGLGFDVAEMTAETRLTAARRIRVRPKVVDAGHHRRRMMRLTGLEMHENQARRLLNDLDSYRCVTGLDDDEQIVARRWVTDVYEASPARHPPRPARQVRGPRARPRGAGSTAGTPRSAPATTSGLDGRDRRLRGHDPGAQARRGRRPGSPRRRPGPGRRRGRVRPVSAPDLSAWTARPAPERWCSTADTPASSRCATSTPRSCSRPPWRTRSCSTTSTTTRLLTKRQCATGSSAPTRTRTS